MSVDDSAVIRGLVTRGLETDPDIKVVATARNGQVAIDMIKKTPVDVIVLDIEMPEMDGLTALPKLLKIRPSVKVVMASTLTQHNAEVTMKALKSGAADYVPKPTAMRGASDAAEEFQSELRAKVRALTGLPPSNARKSTHQSTTSRSADPRTFQSVKTRPSTGVCPSAIAIGSSTGGPQALFATLTEYARGIKQPIFITQHMPATFTKILADHISRQCKVDCVEAKNGDLVRDGKVFVAPGGKHMTIERQGPQTSIKLLDTPPENYCKPSVDPMLRSLVEAYGKNLLTVILTGMGSDGLNGSEEVVKAGGEVIAQDEKTSTVWGMPGAVAQAGICSAVLPIDEIGRYVRDAARRGRS